MTTGRIAFQGNPGAYSHQACVEAFPGLEGLPNETFEAAIAAVREGGADLAMLPVENSTYGRIADIHHLLPESGLHIIGEHFVRVHANLLALPGTPLAAVRTVLSQAPLLGQCRGFLKAHGIAPRVGADTAGSAQVVRETGDPSLAALASELESYMLDGQFTATQFYADVEGHPDEPRVRRALDELGYFTTHLQILGVYPRSGMRDAQPPAPMEAEAHPA